MPAKVVFSAIVMARGVDWIVKEGSDRERERNRKVKQNLTGVEVGNVLNA